MGNSVSRSGSTSGREGSIRTSEGRGTAAERRLFEGEYPRKQVFTKTDLAKFMNVWRQKPEIVSRGAQKNFADFASFIGGEVEPRTPTASTRRTTGKRWRRRSCSRTVERIVTDQPWYQGRVPGQRGRVRDRQAGP